MKKLYTLAILLFSVIIAYGQGNITAAGTAGTIPINFDGSTAGILNGSFGGLQISATPAAGELDMNGVYIRDNIPGTAEDASVAFGMGGTTASNAAMQGTSGGGVSASGIYSFDIGGGNRALGFQPSGDRWNDLNSDEGHIIFRFQNNSGVTLNSFTVGFNLLERNDQSRRTIVEAYVTNDIATPSFGAAQFSQSTTAAAAAAPAWTSIANPTFTSNVTVVDGDYVYLRFLVYEGSGGSGSRDELALDDIFIYGNLAALPVEVSPLEATNINEDVVLNWHTVTETNNSVFEIQRGTDGIHFKTIGYRKGQLESNQRIDYTFTDAYATNGINYYRVKQVDIDERYSFSDIAQVDVIKEGIYEANIYPNPITNGQLNIELESAIDDMAKISIYYINGQEVFSENWSLIRGLNNLPLAINELAAGNYILSIKGKNIMQQQLIFVGE